MKITQEQLQAMITDAVAGKFTEMGNTVSEGLKTSIAEEVKSIMNSGFKAKDFLSEDEEIVPKTADPKAGFKNFSEFAIAVKNAETSRGQRVDKRLSDLEVKAAGTSMNETDAEYGGFLIPEEYRNQILEIAVNKSNIINMALTIPMATNTINIPYLSGTDRSGGLLHGGVEFKWLDEEGQKSETRPKFGKIMLRLKKMAGLAYTSDEILEDSPVSLEPLLTRMFGDALARQLDNVFLNGSGAGKPLGVLNAPCLISVPIETGQAADTILYENLTKMYSRMWGKSNAIFMANDDTFPQLASMFIAVGTGGSAVYLPAGGASGKPYDTLMGKPLIFTEHCRTVGDVGDLIGADWSQYLVGQKAGAAGGLKFASSIHLKFDYDQTAFRFVFRIDGQPWWPAPLTPRYSVLTVSPFVCIAARA